MLVITCLSAEPSQTAEPAHSLKSLNQTLLTLEIGEEHCCSPCLCLGGGDRNGKLGDELLNRERFTTLEEARVLIEQWRREYNQVRPHSALRYRLPAPEAVLIRLNKWYRCWGQVTSANSHLLR